MGAEKKSGRTMTYAQRATEYAKQVVAGEIISCAHVINACKRHLSDLEHANTDDFPYVFNPLMSDSDGVEYEPVERVCYFIEQLPHVKGKWAREKKNIKMEPWQIFIIASVMGWINVNTGMRRFKTCYVEVPRKNAKTTLAAGLALYLEVRDDEAGAEVYSAATTADQAKISFDIAKQMVEKSKGMQIRFGVKAFTHSIVVARTGSSFKYLSSDSHGLDGLNISAAIIDELHAHKTRDVFDVVETGTGSREQPIIFVITTAGSNRAGICYEQRIYTLKLLNGTVQDETYFGIVFTLDEKDDWTDEKVWIKANPNYGVSVFPEDIQRKCKKATQVASAQNNFKTKHLNVWVNADVAWMDMQNWDSCVDLELNLDQFHGESVIEAIDLASKIDIAAKMSLFQRMIDGKRHFYVFGKYYLPEETVQTSTNDFYDGWVKDGWLTATEGNIIDFGVIEDDLREDKNLFQIEEVPYDPFQATQLSTRMMAEGFPMVQMGATVKNFSEPMKELDAIVRDGRLHHNGDPVLAWMISNVVCHTDAKENIFPRKERSENKIDGSVALIMAIGRAITREIESGSVYSKRGIISLD